MSIPFLTYLQVFKLDMNEGFAKGLNSNAWKVSKYGVFSGLNTGKYGPEKTPYLDTNLAVFFTAKTKVPSRTKTKIKEGRFFKKCYAI